MPDNKNCNAPCQEHTIKEAVCIDTARVYDSCADKDCLADLRVYFTDYGQNVIDSATTVRCRGCEVINVFTEIDKVPFNRGCYSVDMTFFFKVTLDAFTCPTTPPTVVCGLSVFSKKCILYGSEGKVKVFSSEFSADRDEQLAPSSTNPRAKIQVATPICLDAKLCRPCDCCDNLADAANGIPSCISRTFEGNFVQPSTEKAVRVTIGLFTIVQLVRDVQLLIPAYDFCVPTKECSCDTEDPCDAFRRIRFPIDEFFPPNEQGLDGAGDCSCGNRFEPDCGCSRD